MNKEFIKTKNMFRKLVSGLPFSPALVGSLGFYAKRLKKEEATRRLGLIFTALALVVQSFAVFSPPEPANAASSNDLIYGGITTLQEVLAVYDDPTKDFKKILNYNGITRAELAAAKETTINSQEYGKDDEAWKSWGRNSRFSEAQGEVKHNINGTIVYSRPLWRFDTTAWTSEHGSTYEVFKGTSQSLGVFAIIKDCGNLAATRLPVPPPPPPQPSAECKLLEAIKVSDNRYRFRVTAGVRNGATVSSYTVVVKNNEGVVVKTLTEPSHELSVTFTASTYPAGDYIAKATVKTSVGDRSSLDCVKPFGVPRPPTPTNPAVSLDKKVDGEEHKIVEVKSEFHYQVVVKNTGDTTLHNLVISDTAPDGVAFVRSTLGDTHNGTWSHTVGSLEAGKTITVTITAKIPEYKQGMIKNTACVETPTVPGTSPDDCDDAVVELPVPEIKVCELRTFRVITIKETAFNATLHSKNLDDCKRIQVCDLATNTIIMIRETDFDSDKQTKELAKCEKIQVCEIATGEIITIARHDFDSTKHSEEPYDCQKVITLTKSVHNLTQNIKADTSSAQAGDRLQFTLTAQNDGKVHADTDFRENLTDTLEYATINDNGGGAVEQRDGTTDITWGRVSLQPGEKITRTFTVKVLDSIPLTARGTSDPGSYDCIMTNTFGNTVDVRVNCEAPKAVEAAVTQLPSTGPGENMLFAGILGSVVTFFYARSRQLAKEVRLIRKDFNAGAL